MRRAFSADLQMPVTAPLMSCSRQTGSVFERAMSIRSIPSIA
jgi:hypothetical protein